MRNLEARQRDHARRMRKSPTSNEAKLWELLRRRRVGELKFRRQAPIGPYIVDFACLRHRLIIEADGPFHVEADDQRRDAWLASEGYRVLRFSNEIIATNPMAVIAAILGAVETRGEAGATPHPSASRPPSPPRGEGSR